MNFLSIFTGIGGFDAGFEAAGMECIGQCEIDRWANMVLRYHYPDTKRIEDVKKLTKSSFNVRPDLICGGFPCQDLSVAGKRAGLAGGRSGLFFEFERIVTEFKPPWFVLENVPGLLSSNEKRDFATVLRRLGQCGYLQAYRVLDSQYFRVAQRRRRVFIVGSLGNGCCAKVLFESESLPGNPAEGRAKGQGFTHDVAPCLASSGRGVERAGESRGQDPVVVGPIACNAGPNSHDAGNFHCNQGVDSGHIIPVAATETGAGFWSEGLPRLRVSTAPSQPQTIVADVARTLSARNDGSPCIDRGLEVIAFCHRDNGRDATENLSPTLRCFNPKSEGVNLPVGGMAVCFQQNTRDEVRKMNGDGDLAGCLAAEPGMKQQNYVCFEPGNIKRKCGSAPNKTIVPTLGSEKTGDTFPHIASNYGVRRLTPRECERLQGFPSIKKQIRISICLGPQKKCADAEIKNHKSLKPVGNAGKSRLSGSAPSAEQNLNQKNLNSNKHAHPNVHINLEGKKVEILNQEKQKLFVSTAANPKWYHRHIAKVDFVHLVAFISSTLENITRSGRVEFQQSEHYSIHQKNGETCVELYGKNLMQLAEFAEKDSTTLKKLLNSTTYCHGNTSNIASTLTTSFSHVILAIIGFIQSTTRTGNTFTIQINTEFGWTRWGIDENGNKVEISDTQRYKMCGNAISVPVAQWIAKRTLKA